MTDLDLDAHKVTEKIRHIVSLLDNAVHLFSGLPWLTSVNCGHDWRLATEFRRNPELAKAEDEYIARLRTQRNKDAQFGLITLWLYDGEIDHDQAMFMAHICGIADAMDDDEGELI